MTTHDTTQPSARFPWMQGATLETLTDQANSMALKAMAALYSVPPSTLRLALIALGVRRSRQQPITGWVKKLDYVSELAKQYTCREIAQKLGHCEKHTRMMLSKHGIKPVPARRGGKAVWAERLPTMRELAKTMTAEQMAAHFGVAPYTMERALRQHGLHARRPPKLPQPITTLHTPSPKQAVLRSAGQHMARTTATEVIWPEHVQVQRIETHIPKNAPITATTMQTTYRTGHGDTSYQSI